MRSLALISILISLAACGPVPYENLQKSSATTNCLAQLKPRFSTIVYHAKVNVTGKHLSGLLLFKMMNDSITRVLFTNEMGVTFFDFEYTASGFRVVSCVEQMNKKVVINRLRSDLSLLIMHDIDFNKAEMLASGNEIFYRVNHQDEHIYYITDSTCSQLNRIETVGGKKKKIIVNLTEPKSGMADSVYLAHQSFEYNISLKQIAR